jgi:hypothetical protein
MWSRCGAGGVVGGVTGGVAGGVAGGVVGGGVDDPVGDVISVWVLVPQPTPRTAIKESEEIVSSRRFSIYGPGVF